MASSNNSSGQEEIKYEFVVKEGRYKLSSLSSDYCIRKVTYQTTHNHPVNLSLATVNDEGGRFGRLVYNYSRDLFTFAYQDPAHQDGESMVLDNKTYKGAIPLCHDFNMVTRSAATLNLIVGFNTGQMQLLNVAKCEVLKNFNESRNVDNSKVTCIKWIPGKESLFIVSYFSGNFYVYDENLPCANGPVIYTVVKECEHLSLSSTKVKSQQRNPLYKWTIGKGSINGMAFSPDCHHLATVSQDGYMRVFHYENQTFVASMRSYFGGLLCVAWSSDGKYIAVGGEDDLVTVWSFVESVIVARCDGHRSWVNSVAFDPYTVYVANKDDASFSGSEDESSTNCNKNNNDDSENPNVLSYRIGSVGQDTQLLLWDIGEDVLTAERCRKQVQSATSNIANRSSTVPRASINDLKLVCSNDSTSKSDSNNNKIDGNQNNNSDLRASPHLSKSNSFLKDKTDKDKKKKKDKWDKRFGTGRKKHPFAKIHPQKEKCESKELTPSIVTHHQACPSINEIPLIQPILAKKIAHERVTFLMFREDCIICCSRDGQVIIWIRPVISTESNANPVNESNFQSPKSSQTSQSSIGTVL